MYGTLQKHIEYTTDAVQIGVGKCGEKENNDSLKISLLQVVYVLGTDVTQT